MPGVHQWLSIWKRSTPKHAFNLPRARLLSHGAIAATLRPHTYSPLLPASREFRLLSLLPAERSEPIHAKLSRVNLQGGDRLSPWTCLSYSWRNFEEQKELIWVNDQPFLVTSNLHKALLHLRSDAEPQSLWVDQICIDQLNTAERSWQVRLLGEIFQSADSVLAWLGADDWATRTTTELVAQLTEQDLKSRWFQNYDTALHPQSEPRHGRWLLQRLLTLLEDDESNRVPFEQAKAVLINLFSRFIQNPWFDRLWIVQEAALANRLQLQSGYVRAPWDSFKAAIDTIHVFSGGTFQPDWEKFMSIHHVRQATSDSTDANFSPSALVRHHRYRQALDDRDKIFAIVGLCKIPELGNEWIDYDQSVESIYTSFVRRCIRHEKTLDVLHGCCSARLPWEYSLPSWATDWTEKRHADAAHHCGLTRDDSIEAKEGVLPMSESDVAALDRFGPGNSICLQGYQLDTIEYIYAGSHHPSLIENPSSATWAMWEEKFRRHWHWRSMNDRESHLEAFWRTMSAEHTTSESSDLRDQFTRWWSLRESKTRSPDDLADCTDWLARLRRIVRPNSRIFFTQSGRVGLTCEHAQVGDMLCLLEGGRNLFLLRGEHQQTGIRGLVESKFVLIGGETFVDDFSIEDARDFVHLNEVPLLSFCIK